jgi:hypothetical protein
LAFEEMKIVMVISRKNKAFNRFSHLDEIFGVKM